MDLLPPTVIGPLVAGASRVRVEGITPIVSGAPFPPHFVVVQRDSSPAFPSPTTTGLFGPGSTATVALPTPLVTGEWVRSRVQNVFGTASPWSPAEEVLPFSAAAACRARPRVGWPYTRTLAPSW
jgi:hypothetical protein